MEDKRKFRNHISIIAEQIGGGIVALAVFVAAMVIQDFDEFSDLAADLSQQDLSAFSGTAVLVLLGVAALIAVLVVNRFFVWSKTWICLEENAIVIEVNTVNKKKNTISIRNISNINLEQNLFEMLLGTCKVKLDTNSRSTAEKTDVKIVLKKKDAERFKQEILARMREYAGETQGQATGAFGMSGTAGTDRLSGEAGISGADYCARESAAYGFDGQNYGAQSYMGPEDDGGNYDVRADLGDILQHGLFSVNLFSILILVGGIAAAVAAVTRLVSQPDFMQTLLSAAAAILVVAALVFSALWDTVKDFVRYYDFRAKRVGSRIYIRYGLLKKVEYMIPVDKIQALVIRQSLVARLSRRYMAEIVNVGMGDEKEEKDSFLLLYMKKDKMEQCLSALLPEFAGTVKQETKRQPASTWAAWLIPFGIYVLVVCATAAGFAIGMGEYRMWALPGAVAAVLLALLFMTLSYIAAGVGIGEDFLKISHGYFGRSYICMRYRNIQYVEIKENVLARLTGIRHGKVHLLASAGNSEHEIPYYKGREEERIREYMLRRQR
ncbi:PH domain-containing protein [Lachnoclostridium sp. An169]|uniref:PH domain-containing protein n=1 Tax=Lachnoclostridium sp. An169 TaxID=1965569 RepID=UPI0013A67129|nr:PH domain-containing protein [Lachnoclostridium sp. An169]